jgi:CubicO group peptidase (beta-lactamase class C family)
MNGLLAGALAVASGVAAPQALAGGQGPITDVRQVYSGEMRPDAEVEAFQHADRLLPVRPVRRGGAVRTLPASARRLENVVFTVGTQRYDLYDYLALNRVAGLLVLKDGAVVFEDYELGHSATAHWPSFSIAKSVASTLVGAAIQDGLIGGLDDPLTRYLPKLSGGGYDGVTVRQILQMSSGVRWDETYTDPRSDRRKVLDLQMSGRPGAVMEYMAALPRAATPGTVWNYNTGEIFVVGALIESATHRSLAQYLSDKIWSRAGMEADASWWTETPDGMGLAGTGLNATLRDFGRFGLLVLDDGVLDGQRLVPPGWFREAGSAKLIGGKSIDYGYLWWPLPKGDPVHEGAFWAEGIFGQYLYLNPRERLAISVQSARPKPTGANVDADAAFFAAVAKALH